MIFSMNKRIIIFTILIIFATASFSQTTMFYKLIRKVVANESITNVSGGQFITFINNECYESDIKGIGVGHGTMRKAKVSAESYILYIGSSYWGTSASFKFNSNKSVLNVVFDNGDIYVYKRETPPSTQTTSSLIRQKNSNGISSNQDTYNPAYDGGYDNSYNGSSTVNDNSNTLKQKTKVRKKCSYCDGKGKTIQHEYVSTMGLSGPRVYCNICNKSWNYGTVHAHHRCEYCKGSGYYEYEY